MGRAKGIILTDYLMVFFSGSKIDKNINRMVSLVPGFEA